MSIRHVGFVGLGNMGVPMAARLYDAGFRLTVHDASTSATEAFAGPRVGVSRATTSGDFADVDVLVLMLPSSQVVESVLEAADGPFGGLLDVLGPGTLVVDMSSSEPLRTRALAGRLASRDLRLVDAPVSGGVRGAVAGTLAILVGGDTRAVAELRPLLSQLGQTTIEVGPAGAGHAAKALNNLVSAASISITVEALHLGADFGIPAETMTAVLNSSSGRSNTSENKVAQFMTSGTFGSGFALALMAKDVRIAVGLARSLDHDTEIADRIADQWSRIAATVPPETDHTAMYDLIAGRP